MAEPFDQELDDAAGADVVELFPGADKLDHERPVAPIEKERRWCSHRRVSLDRDSRRVYCRDCTEEVDAFEVLVNLAEDPRRYVENRKHLHRECKRLEQRVADLKREERNTRARLRRTGARREVVASG